MSWTQTHLILLVICTFNWGLTGDLIYFFAAIIFFIMSFLSLWEENRSSKTDYVLKRLSREIEKDRFEMIMNKLNQIQKEMKKQRRSFIKKQEGKNGKRN